MVSSVSGRSKRLFRRTCSLCKFRTGSFPGSAKGPIAASAAAFLLLLGSVPWATPAALASATPLPEEIMLLPMIVAGDPSGSPADTPTDRIDANTTSSPFAGVGSITSSLGRCSGTVISQRHVITAAHCFDNQNDGTIDASLQSIVFNLNFGGDLTHQIGVGALDVNPEYLGTSTTFSHDLAILTLLEDVPAGLPVYELATMAFNDKLTLVGYGQSGNGTESSFSVGGSSSVKRVGGNVNDAFFSELFGFDFDAPDTVGQPGGSLGNDIETMIGPGDSGGAAFVTDGLQYYLAGVTTFRSGSAPSFGSLGGGVRVGDYNDWIGSVVTSGAVIAAPAPASMLFLALGGAFLAARRRSAVLCRIAGRD